MPHILIVDDNPENIKVVGSILERENMDISFALDGDTALKMLVESKFDLILLDIILPGMDGFTICQHIKKIQLQKETPIIFLTAKTEIESLAKGFEMGGVDYVTKPFQEKELIARIKTHTELSHSRKQLTQALTSITRDLNMAREIQRGILIKNLKIPNVKLQIEYQPMIEVGGDFYDVEEIQEKKIRVFIADATGHGVQAALMTMVIKGEYERIKTNDFSMPDRVLAALNENYIQNFQHLANFFTCALVDIDLEQKKLYYSSAAHPQQLLLTEEGDIIHLITEGSIVGMVKESYYRTIEHRFSCGDRLVLYSDGLTETYNQKGEQFGQDKFIELAREMKQLEIQDFCQKILQENKKFRNNSQAKDDIILIALQCAQMISMAQTPAES